MPFALPRGFPRVTVPVRVPPREPLPDVEKRDRDYVYLAHTASLCPDCKRVLQAKVVEKEGKVYLHKRCPDHGFVESLQSSDAAYYRAQQEWAQPGTLPQRFQTETEQGCPLDCGLCPDHEQHTCLGLIDLTDACNMRCPTCFADSDVGVHLPLATVEKMVDALVASEGVADIVQFSGGEPTLHPQLFEILDMARRKRVRHVMLNTNGIRIANDEAFVRRLAEYREDFEVYLQFDGFRKGTFLTLRGQDMTSVRERALANLAKHDVPTTLVAVLERGVNEDEAGAVVRHALKFRNVRGVTFQPQTHAGRWTDFDPADRITVPDVIRAVATQAPESFRAEDFVPLPCHPECISMTYALRNGEDVLPLPRVLDVKRLLGVAGNTIAFESEPQVRGALKELWSASAAMQSLRTLKALRCCMPLMGRDAKDVGYENVFRIVIISFMDAWNFDVRSAKKCCVHHVLPDGRIMPFCSYNTLHRTKMVVPP